MARTSPLALLVALLLLGAAAPARADLRVTDTAPVTPRLTEYGMTSGALSRPTRVRVLLPDGYGDDPGRRYPVLYLLHGAFDDFRSWSDKGAVEQITAGRPLIVVMPDGGQGGWYTDWHNRGRGGPPRWETFHLEQLVPWVDRTFRTVAAREGRAVAGLSMGGFGAMSYAARHPDRFVFAASFSGAVDIVNNAPVAGVIAIEAPVDGGQPGDQFGDRVVDEIGWRAHNPWDLAANLRGLGLALATGNGQRGPLDEPGPPDLIETQVREMSASLHRRLDALGIRHAYDDYGPGTHSWPYWQRELRETLPAILDAFARPPRRPDPFTHTAVEPAYDIDGWSVVFDGRAPAFSTLAGASRTGFTLSGNGRATVTTAPLYAPGSVHDVRAGQRTATLRADDRGRLRIALDLGGARGPLAVARRTTVAIDEAPVAGLPRDTAPRACTSRRRIVVRVQRRRGLRIRSVEVRVRGRRTARRTGARVRSIAVDLRGRPKGTYRVAIVVRGWRGGRAVTLTTRRTYRTCG